MKKKTMRPVKKVLGGLLIVVSAGFIFDIGIIKDVVMDFPYLPIIIFTLSGYFLIKSGFQD